MASDATEFFESVHEGQRLPDLRVGMDRGTYFEYNRLTNEINPLHFNEDYARKLGFDDIVVAGVYTFSFVPKIVEDWAGMWGRVSAIEIKYLSPVYIDTTPLHRARVTGKSETAGRRTVEVEVGVEDEDGKMLTRAKVTLEIP